jgi:hypothetical protein
MKADRKARSLLPDLPSMLTLVFTPRASADIPVQIGPVAGVCLEGNAMREVHGGGVLAECQDHHWMFDGKKFYRADCAGPVLVTLEGCSAAIPKRFGPFRHFSLNDGMAYVDRAVFAQLNSSNKWFVERLDAECPRLLLLPLEGRMS